jgi:DNA-binding transcriptional LysR family regulator
MAMDWDKLRVFHAVAEAGSFTHAGESLNLSQSAVSRQISALEESLSVPLFHRHARGLILTEQGELLFRTAREVFAKLAMAEGLISESKDRPKGPLKITTTVAFGSNFSTSIRRFRSVSSSTIRSSIYRCARPMSRSACRHRANPI